MGGRITVPIVCAECHESVEDARAHQLKKGIKRIHAVLCEKCKEKFKKKGYVVTKVGG